MEKRYVGGLYAHAYTHTCRDQYWRNRLVGVAAAFRGRVTVVISDEEEYAEGSGGPGNGRIGGGVGRGLVGK